MFEERDLNEPIDNIPNDTQELAIWFTFGSIRARFTTDGQHFAENLNKIISETSMPFVTTNLPFLQLDFSNYRLLLNVFALLLLTSLHPRGKSLSGHPPLSRINFLYLWDAPPLILCFC